MTKQAPARETVIGGDRQVHGDGLINKNALFASLLRHQRQPARHRINRVARRPRLMIEFAAFNAAFRRAEQRLAQLGFPGPRQPGDTENFTFMQVQTDIFQQPFIMQPFHAQQRFISMRLAFWRIDIV